MMWSRLCDSSSTAWWTFGCPVLGRGVDMPIFVHVVFFELRTVEVPQLQYLDQAIDVFFVQPIDGVDVL